MTDSLAATPIRLDANQPADRFYRGGARISRFRRRDDTPSERIPEDWIASTTSVRNHDPVGQTVLPDGVPLLEATLDHPEWWLGAAHYRKFGADTKLLVKLLDAGERLPIHAHPDVSFARPHVGAAHGKAEAWYILSKGEVHLGLRRKLDGSELARIVDSQESARLLAAMHRINVRAGDRVFVPPGVLHSIGAGVFLAEVQEPEDLSILLEWDGFDLDGRRDGHLGIGFESALQAVDTSALSASGLTSLITTSTSTSTSLPAGADEYFRLDRVPVAGVATLEAGFAVVLVLEGTLMLAGSGGTRFAEAGDTFVVPHAAGDITAHGRGTFLIARPPAT